LRAIVVGGDSRIGMALAAALARRGDVVHATTRRACGAEGGMRLDLADEASAAQPLPAADIAFFCAAITRFADCRADPVRARQVNVTGPAALAKRLVREGTRVVLLSTNAVFDGAIPRVPADLPPSTSSLYGRLKIEAESLFLALGSAASVLRLTKVLLPEAPLITGWISALLAGEAIDAFSDFHIAPIAMSHAVAALFAVVDDGGGGIYQVSAARDVSYFDVARQIALALGAGPTAVRERLAVAHGIPAEEVTRYASLDDSRIAALTRQAAPDPRAVIASVYGPALAAATNAAKHVAQGRD
jgi:dTDP-4-dehydrorhamnose reductase